MDSKFMKTPQRHSPITFPGRAIRTDPRDNMEIVLEYEDEGEAPWLVDLSHLPKWNLQGENLSSLSPGNLPMPPETLDCTQEANHLITRVKTNWAMIWDLSGRNADRFDDFACTDVTEAYAMLAVIGRHTFAIMEKVTNLDLTDPTRKPPFLQLGPVLHVRTQTVVLDRDSDTPAVIIAAARGYGQCMAEALLEAGAEWNLRPAGESVFTRLI